MIDYPSQHRLHGYILLWLAVLALLAIGIFIIAALVMQEDDWGQERLLLTEEGGLSELPPSPQRFPSVEVEAAALSHSSSSATLAPVQDRRFDLGVHVLPDIATNDESIMAGYLDAAANDLNLNWVRVEIRWDELEPELGARQWATLDAFFRAAVNYDLKVLALISGSPLWLRAPGANPDTQSPPQDEQAFTQFVSDVLRRYPNQIHGVEVWEAMNLRQHWDANLNGADYIRLLGQVAGAVRSIDPNIILISGGLAPVAQGDGMQRMDNFTYMDMMINAGLLDIVDCVGVQHSGYNLPPGLSWDEVPADSSAHYRPPFDNPHPAWSFTSTLFAYANKITLAGYRTPLCVTAFGWAVAEDLPDFAAGLGFAQDNSLQEQARWMVEAVELMRQWDFVWLAFIWNLNAGPDTAFDPTDAAVAYSLMRPEGAQAPVWAQIAAMTFRQPTGEAPH